MASGIGAATGGFWTVTGTGTCPSSVWSIPYINAEVSFGVMCSDWALAMVDKMKFVVLLVFAWYAFRICLD